MSTCVHPRFSWGYLVLIISSFFAAMYFFSLSLSSPVSVALGCLFLIALLIYSNVYCHSHFIPHIFPCPCHLWIVYSRLPYRFSLTFIAIAISSPPHFCLCPCQLLIVYSWLPFRFPLTFIAIAISYPLFCLRPCQLLIVYSSLHFRWSLMFITIAISSAHFCLCPCQPWIVYSWLHFRFSLTFIAISISSLLFCLARVNSGLFILDYTFDYLWCVLP
jgi:uncharacterized membrane protein